MLKILFCNHGNIFWDLKRKQLSYGKEKKRKISNKEDSDEEKFWQDKVLFY